MTLDLQPSCRVDLLQTQGVNVKPETAVINVFGKHNIYLEHHRNDDSAKTIILVNGAFATTTSFGQTVRYLRDKVNVLLFDLPYAGVQGSSTTALS